MIRNRRSLLSKRCCLRIGFCRNLRLNSLKKDRIRTLEKLKVLSSAPGSLSGATGEESPGSAG